MQNIPLAYALWMAPLVLTTMASPQVEAPRENLIHVDIDGFRNEKGQVRCALFSLPADFPKRADKAIAQTKGEILRGRASCEFSGIGPGTYAISAFHDENSNGKLDTNILGIPREGVGASNDAKGHFGPPKFDQASFRFSGGRLDLKVTILYL